MSESLSPFEQAVVFAIERAAAKRRAIAAERRERRAKLRVVEGGKAG